MASTTGLGVREVAVLSKYMTSWVKGMSFRTSSGIFILTTVEFIFMGHINALLLIFVLSNIPTMEQNFINIGTKK
ncbi:MAG: hypothetical protein DRP38_07205 [Thermotogae bacterium]|nr:MAG: hypothetical protein DRP38_07205 [Thermotogota bacterium]